MIFLTNLNKNFSNDNYSSIWLTPFNQTYSVLVSLKKDYDILELDMRVDYPYEDGDTDCKLWFKYMLNGEEFSRFDFEVPEDELYSDIKDYIELNLKIDTGITDYEIFDVHDDDSEHQTAKIKAKRIEIGISNINYIL